MSPLLFSRDCIAEIVLNSRDPNILERDINDTMNDTMNDNMNSDVNNNR